MKELNFSKIERFICMYMSMYTMAKNIMISDGLYFKLKTIKEMRNESFSEVITELVNNNKTKKMKNLKEVYGCGATFVLDLFDDGKRADRIFFRRFNNLLSQVFD